MAGYISKELLEKLKQTNNYKYYEKYRRSKRVKGFSEHSLKTYKSYFMHFLRFLHEKYDDIDLYSGKFFEDAVDIMEDFMMYVQEDFDNHKKVTNTKISAISSFFLWSVKRRIIKSHPFNDKLDRIKGAKDEKIRKSQFLTQEQIDTVKRELAISEKYDLQDQLLFSLVIDTGNRVGAIEQLKLSNMDLENMLFADVIEKGNKLVEVIFEGEETKDLIEEWLDYRKESMDNLEVDALFLTKYGGIYKPMTYQTLQERFSRIGKEILGLERFGMHDGRKTKGNLIYEETGDLSLAQAYLNHKSPGVTQEHYIKPKSKTDLRKNIMEKRLKKKLEDEKIKKMEEEQYQ